MYNFSPTDSRLKMCSQYTQESTKMEDLTTSVFKKNMMCGEIELNKRSMIFFLGL